MTITSQRLFLLWFVLLVVPYGVLTLAAGLFVLGVTALDDGSSILERVSLLVLVVVALAPYFAGFVLSLKFVRYGSRGLLAVGGVWWLLATLGAAIPAIFFLLYMASFWWDAQLIAQSPDENPFGLLVNLSKALYPAVFLAPLLLPYVHLVIERSRARKSYGQ